MPLEQYLKYIDRKTLTESAQHTHLLTGRKKKLSYARIIQHKRKLTFTIPDSRLGNNIPIANKETHNNGIVALKWINTRNTFSKHVLRCLLFYQRDFFRSGKDADLKPLTLKQFLLIYSLEHLDRSRLSRILPTLLVETPHGKLISLRELFPSKKRCYAYSVEEIINENDKQLNDKDVQNVLALKGTHLSLRTICNCRKMLSIPNYKQRLSQYYGKNTRFSDYVKLSKGQYNRISSEAGVYELSIASNIQYAKHRSNVLYIGSSKNIRKRVLNYSGSNGKNGRLKQWTNGSDLFVRYFLTEHYIKVEKELLKQFKRTYGELTKVNKLGG